MNIDENIDEYLKEIYAYRLDDPRLASVLDEVSDVFSPASMASLYLNKELIGLLWEKLNEIFIESNLLMTKESAVHLMMYVSIYSSIKFTVLDKSKITKWNINNPDSEFAEYINEILI